MSVKIRLINVTQKVINLKIDCNNFVQLRIFRKIESVFKFDVKLNYIKLAKV